MGQKKIVHCNKKKHCHSIARNKYHYSFGTLFFHYFIWPIYVRVCVRACIDIVIVDHVVDHWNFKLIIFYPQRSQSNWIKFWKFNLISHLLLLLLLIYMIDMSIFHHNINVESKIFSSYIHLDDLYIFISLV